jgi:hypothetical protein
VQVQFPLIRKALSVVLIGIIVVLLGQSQSHAMVMMPAREYRLYGSLMLSYDRAWRSNSEVFERTTYSLNLGLSGFIIDPRLIAFDVNGLFSQSFASNADTNTVDGISAKLTFLGERPRVGPLRYFPQPIELRYSYFSYENFTSQNYGISMSYQLSGLKELNVRSAPDANNKQNTGQNNGQQVSKQPWYVLLARPDFYFDYDRHEGRNSVGTTTYDRLDLRADARSEHLDYFAEYRYEKSNFETIPSKTQLLEFQVNFHRYWKESSTRLESYNTLFFEKRGTEDTVSFFDQTSFVKNMGPDLRDSVVINGGGRYFSRNNSTEYGLNLDAGYNKFFSERFSNSALGILTYISTETERRHAGTVKDIFQYNFSNYLSVIGQTTAGRADNGSVYGLGISFPFRARFAITPGYDFYYASDTDDEKRKLKINTFSLDLAGPLLRNMSFSSQNYYRITDIDEGISSSKNKTLSLMANVFWLIERFNFSVGATYLDTTVGERFGTGISHLPEAKRTYTTIYANAYAYLTRQLLLNVMVYYQKEKQGGATTSITPLLTWQWRRVSASAQYTLNIRENSETDHRIFLRVTRQLGSTLKPFL